MNFPYTIAALKFIYEYTALKIALKEQLQAVFHYGKHTVVLHLKFHGKANPADRLLEAGWLNTAWLTPSSPDYSLLSTLSLLFSYFLISSSFPMNKLET